MMTNGERDELLVRLDERIETIFKTMAEQRIDNIALTVRVDKLEASHDKVTGIVFAAGKVSAIIGAIVGAAAGGISNYLLRGRP
jgi:hypothetical protein